MSAVPPGFRPKGAGTGVGSMPHAEARACVDAAVSARPELPFWPTRPLAVAAATCTLRGKEWCAARGKLHPTGKLGCAARGKGSEVL